MVTSSPTPSQPSRTLLRRVLAPLVLVAFGIVLAILLAEIILAVVDIRMYGSAQRRGAPILRDERLGWIYRPGATFTYDGTFEKFGVLNTINSRGFRDREHAFEKEAGVFRILVLGDSFAVSREVPLEQAWHVLLERGLNERAGRPDRVEVISGSVQGWSTDQEYLYYHNEGYKFDPDLVLLQFYPNDIYGNSAEVVRLTMVPTEMDKPFFVVQNDRLVLTDPFRTDRGMLTPTARRESPARRVKDFLRDHLRTYRLASRVKQIRSGTLRPRVPFCYEYNGVPPELYTYAAKLPPGYRSAWDVTAHIFQALKSETARRGQRLAVVYFPDRRQVLPREWQKTLQCWPAATQVAWDLDKPNHFLGDALAKLDVPYLDLTDTFRRQASAGRSIYYETDWHLNPEGHRLVDAELSAWLRRASLAPPQRASKR